MTPAQRRAVERADRRVRRAVVRYEGCLADLPVRQRRVLRLRAGIGPPPPASRTTVARRLDLEVAQVRRAERRGVRALRRVGREGCAVVSDGDPTGFVPIAAGDGGTTLLATGGGEFSEEVLAGSGAGADATDGSGTDEEGGGSGSGSDSDSSGLVGSGSGGVKGATAVRPAPGGDAYDLTLPLVLLILGAFAAVGVWRLWRSRAGAGADGDAAALD